MCVCALACVNVNECILQLTNVVFDCKTLAINKETSCVSIDALAKLLLLCFPTLLFVFLVVVSVKSLCICVHANEMARFQFLLLLL